MKTAAHLALLLLLARPALAQQPPRTVVIPSGNLRLKGFLWLPPGRGPFPAVLFNHGSGGDDAQHTAGLTMTEAAAKLAPVFLGHRYAFLYPCRRGHGLSADQGPFLQDLLGREEAARGLAARKHLQFVLTTSDHLEDVLAALSFLKTVPGVDRRRIAVVGQSLGGQLTLLLAERDPSLRAAVTFGAAAGSWGASAELRERLLAAVRKTAVPIMLTQAKNDFDTAPSLALAAELERLHKPHLVKIYSAVGQTPEEGHNALYNAMPAWEADVFTFLDRYLKR